MISKFIKLPNRWLLRVWIPGDTDSFEYISRLEYSSTITGFPLGLENLENGKAFSSQGILNRLEKSGKIMSRDKAITARHGI